MQGIPKPGTLSTGDALFLYFERQGQPVNVASVNVFEGVISLDDCIELIQSRLALIPRYLQRVVAPPYNMDAPSWEYDPTFDIRNHVREIVMKQGTEAEFKRIAGQILSAALDRDRPLWDFTLLCGLKGDRTGAIIRMHHCLADGIAGVGLMNVLMDQSPTPNMPRHTARFDTPPQIGERSLLNDLVNSSMSMVKRFLSAQSELLLLTRQIVEGTQKQNAVNKSKVVPSAEDVQGSIIDKWMSVLPEIAEPPQRLPFNVVCRGPQKFNWAEIPLAELKAVKDACGATINDVVLTIVTATIRRYAEQHGVGSEGRRLRVVVPVNIRAEGTTGDFGNRITFLPVNIPLNIQNPRKLIDAVQMVVARARSAHMPELVGLLGTWIGTIPSTVQAMMGPLISQLPLSLCNLICTNVPGPQVPLYFAGHRMLSCYPYVPIGGEMGMNCAVLTYNGIAYFGFTGDAKAIPDLELLAKFLKTSFDELRNASGVSTGRRKRSKEKSNRRGRGNKKAILVKPSKPSLVEGSASSEPVADHTGSPGELEASQEKKAAALAVGST